MALHRLVIAAEAIRDAAANALRGYGDDGGSICTSHIAFLRVLDEAEATARQFGSVTSHIPLKSSPHATALSMRAVCDVRELERGCRNQISRNMNCRPPSLASTPNPDTKYGVYICGGQTRKWTRSEIKLS